LRFASASSALRCFSASSANRFFSASSPLRFASAYEWRKHQQKKSHNQSATHLVSQSFLFRFVGLSLDIGFVCHALRFGLL
jgi:hypothetical protein